MPMKLPISAILLTYNEEKNIKESLESIHEWADEVFIVDSGSTDETLAIAKKRTDKIYKHAFRNYASQRNWAQENLPIRNEWIFHIDADEKISEKLASELRRIFSSSVNIDGFMVTRKTIFRRRWIRHGGHYPAYHLRIFKKDKGRCEERLYDQHFIVDGKTAKIDGDIINTIEPNLSLLRTKQKRWAHLEAREIFAGGKTFGERKKTQGPIERKKWLKYNIYYRMPLFVRPFLYLFYRLVLKLGFLDGKDGVLFHFWQGFWFRFLVDVEFYKLRKAKYADFRN